MCTTSKWARLDCNGCSYLGAIISIKAQLQEERHHVARSKETGEEDT